MRRLRLSLTYQDELDALLMQGALRFGVQVARQKRDQVTRTIERFLVRHPVRPVDPVLGICAYPVAQTPFVLLYDDTELRIHLIIHASADRTAIDLAGVVW